MKLLLGGSPCTHWSIAQTNKTTKTNYPETVQLGDAFQVRDENWRIP